MHRSLTCLAITATLVFATGSTIARAQANYGDQRDSPQQDPRYGNPQAVTRGGQQGDRRYDDHRDGDPRGRGGASATFYADDRFGGRSVTLNRGVRRLGEIGMEDKISSVRVNSGRWLVCEDDDFRGRCVTIDRSVGHLSRVGMEDKISSVRPIRRDDQDDDRGRDDRNER
ncbi:beta/gamma crystallin family protein [Sphingosinicellaceae bacterium]|nr:beta/gamma crystallin family protein [Sphingosinicellaceae bacterium]